MGFNSGFKGLRQDELRCAMRAIDSASAPECSVYGISVSQTSDSGNNRCHGNNAVCD